jgi:phytoene synthase
MGATDEPDMNSPVAPGVSLAGFVRQHDPDRYFTTLFAPPSRREALFTLYAFNHELARAREAALREPGLAMIRLQWWREVVDGARRQHEVAVPLAGLLAEGSVPPHLLLAMIDMREEAAAGPPATLQAFVALMRQGPGSLAMAAGAILGACVPRLADLGAAGGIAGTLRNVAALARHGRCDLPVAVLEQAGLVPEAVPANPQAALHAVYPILGAAAGALLGPVDDIERAALAAALPAVFARRDLRRAAQPAMLMAARVSGDRLAVLWAAARGMV